MKKFLLPVIAALSVILTSCDMKFGDDVELSGAAFDATKLSQVSTLTGVTFPTGSVGGEYFYLGSGIDDALAAKIMIPDTAVKEFNTNPVFTTGTDSKANIEIGRGKPWWKIGSLTDRIDRTLNLPNARFLEVTCGRENGVFVVYVSWITT
jgi:hypothetical protein